jgi:2-haloacid dehalogenase
MIRCIAFDCFGTLFDMSGIPQEQIADYVRHVRSENFTPYNFPSEWYNLKAHPDVLEGIRRLKAAGIKCVALSNGHWGLIRFIAEESGFHFDHVCDLVGAKVYKPHVDAYRVVERDTGFTPAETLMVTANPTFGDIEGAIAIGMRYQVIRHCYPKTVIELAEMLGA